MLRTSYKRERRAATSYCHDVKNQIIFLQCCIKYRLLLHAFLNVCKSLRVVYIYLLWKKYLKILVFVDQQHFVNKKQHLFLWIRNGIWLAFVLTVQFIAIRANKTYIKCKIDRLVNLGEPPISDRSCGHVGVQTRLEQGLLLWYNSSQLVERQLLVKRNKAVIFGLWRVQFKIH